MSQSQFTLTKTSSPVRDGFIFVCEKCGKKLASEEADHNPSRDLVTRMKEIIRSSNRKGEWRALITSCLNICPENGIAVGFSRTKTQGDEFAVLKGELDTDQVANALLNHLASQP